MALEGDFLLPGFGVPDARQKIVTRCLDATAVMVEGHICDICLMPWEDES